ncbi:MAG: phenylalanine--tRNA ligase subunit alpha [Candidatus Saliniplasma sp.]
MSKELSYLEKKALLALDELDGKASPDEIKKVGDFDEKVQVMNAVSWLESKGLVLVNEKIINYYSLAKKSLAKRDLPERKALKFLDKAGGKCSISELQENSSLDKKKVGIALGWLKDKKWVRMVKEDGETFLEITSKGKKAIKERGRDEKLIRRLGKEGKLSHKQVDEFTVNKLLSRKEILNEDQDILRTVELTDESREVLDEGIELEPEIAQLTPEIIKTGAWKEARIRPYDVRSFAPSKYGGKRHPISREIEEVKRVWLEMGFTEINFDYIQPTFWNMDALFIPQDHPARELQDTFYMKQPDKLSIDGKIVDRIREMHENGGDSRSKGWGYEWSREEAERAVLRTHTTVCSIKHLAENPEPPVRAVTIDRNYRCEATDSTHLPEFAQIDGILMEEGANLNMLIGLLREFYKKMGFDDIKVRPGYFPFTEPSIEVFAKFKGEFLEMGGAGIFRREVTKPHGIDCPVLAWGLGLERLVMLRLGWDDIRDCYKNDIETLREYSLI